MNNLPVSYTRRLICSDCFFALFPEANPFHGPVWAASVFNFEHNEVCSYCNRPETLLDTYEEWVNESLD